MYDDIKFGLAKDQSAAAAQRRAARRAAKSYYVIKTPEEKRVALLEAMESWVKGMAEFLKAKEITPVHPRHRARHLARHLVALVGPV